MSMNQKDFDAFVKKLEIYANQNPGAYKFQVLLLAVLGYFYIFFILALLVAMLAMLVWLVIDSHRISTGAVKIAIVLLVLILIIARSLWVQLHPPQGIIVRPEKAKYLFQTIEKIREALQAPKTHQVLLTNEFNAAVCQIPRLGIFGFPQNYLILGLPLMQALSPEQFRAVLAHEFGHLSGAHSKFGNWVYRVRRSWYQLMASFDGDDGVTAKIFTIFFDWYAPFFGAYSFVLARTNEYEADNYSAKIAGGKNLADALIALEVKHTVLEENFWPTLYKKADQTPKPPNSLFQEMQKTFQAKLETEDLQKYLDQAMKRETSSADTHPALKDRLAALKQTSTLPAPLKQTAAQYFFGNALPDFAQRLDKEWQQKVITSWQERYEYAQISQKSLAELNQRSQTTHGLTLDESLQRAAWTEEFESAAAALSLYREVLEMYANEPSAHFAIGRILLSQEQEQGIESLKKAMDVKADFTLPSCQLIYNFLMARGREKEAEPYYQRAVRYAEGLPNR